MMMKRLICLFAIVMITVSAMAQRRVNPVKTSATVTQSRNEAKRDSLDKSKLLHMHDANGNVILIDTVTGLEVVDSTAMPMVPKMIYPLLHSAILGVDLWSPVMRAFGTKYGLIGFSGQVSLHNRYIPTFEIGFGQADYTPYDNNYTYHSPMSIYFKLGADYNFLYNSNPDYFFYAGVRYGFSPFKYQLRNVNINDSYWDENSVVEMPDQSSAVGYFEFLLGIKVKVLQNWSMGWSFRYHSVLHESKNQFGDPWYIPGYGSRGSAIGATFSLYYTLPFDRPTKKKLKVVEHQQEN